MSTSGQKSERKSFEKEKKSVDDGRNGGMKSMETGSSEKQQNDDKLTK